MCGVIGRCEIKRYVWCEMMRCVIMGYVMRCAVVKSYQVKSDPPTIMLYYLCNYMFVQTFISPKTFPQEHFPITELN